MTKIVFVCGTLELGKDGVGDYTRRLAGEMIRLGHEAAIVALHDKYATEIFIGFQHDDETSVPVLRIPAATGNKSLLVNTTTFTNRLNPDWISLQYVAFSFHSKGLHVGLSYFLKKIGAGRKWHIMFHEIWVGEERGAKWKFILLGFLQRGFINYLLKNLSIKKIHTNSKFYKELLERHNINSELLPLFSNLNKSNPSIDLKSYPFFLDEKEFIFIVFGTIHQTDSLFELLNEIKLFESQSNETIKLFFVGKNGPLLPYWITSCTNEGISFKVLGEQPSDVIIRLLQVAKIGISTTALPMIEKSGSVAAMLESGLPVICLSHKWKPRSINFELIPEGVFALEQGIVNTCLLFKKKNIDVPKLTLIAEAFNKALYKN